MDTNNPDSKNIDEIIKQFPHITDHLAQLKMKGDGDDDTACNPDVTPEAPGSGLLPQDTTIDEKKSRG